MFQTHTPTRVYRIERNLNFHKQNPFGERTVLLETIATFLVLALPFFNCALLRIPALI